MEDNMGHISTPLAFVRNTITNKIANRSTALVNQAVRGEITHQQYLADQFPADAISFIEKAITQAVDDYNRIISDET
jgi:uncharacterized protein YllA (UPF0747 family)